MPESEHPLVERLEYTSNMIGSMYGDPPYLDPMEIVDATAQSAFDHIGQTWASAKEVCTSRSEQLFLATFLAAAMVEDLVPHSYGEGWYTPPSKRVEHASAEPNVGFCIWPQIEIGTYIAPFLCGYAAENGCKPNWIVECDAPVLQDQAGDRAAHIYHRDRFLSRAGYRVMRFTEAEIQTDVVAVVSQVFASITEKRANTI